MLASLLSNFQLSHHCVGFLALQLSIERLQIVFIFYSHLVLHPGHLPGDLLGEEDLLEAIVMDKPLCINNWRREFTDSNLIFSLIRQIACLLC